MLDTRRHPLDTSRHFWFLSLCIDLTFTIAVELSECTSFQVLRRDSILRRTTSEVHSLAPFPCLGAEEEEECLGEDDAPFPRDTGMFEDVVVDNLFDGLVSSQGREGNQCLPEYIGRGI